MKKLLSLLFCLWIVLSAQAQLQAFTVEHSGSSDAYYHLDTALARAVNGDIIYLPGGIINFSGNITKGVSMIGAGYHPDSAAATMPTRIIANIQIANNVSGVFFSGIDFSGFVLLSSATGLSNFAFERCRIQVTLPLGTIQNVLFKECVIEGQVQGHLGATGLQVSNSVFYNSIIGNGIQFSNSISLKPQANYVLLNYGTGADVRNSTFSSCIFYDFQPFATSFGSSSNNVFNNNIFNFAISNGPLPGQDNIYGVPSANIFASTILSNFTAQNNFHLRAGSPALGAGVGGTDCGIYGGQTPFKEGGVPYNPHIQSVRIGSTTDLNGNLLINVKVAAQAN